ncbi:MAG: hypothetical protein U0W24_17615 [Bacteroidales bacterium]
MKRIKMIMSFDYELPLGGCLSYSKGLFEPSEILFQIAKKKEVPIVLFVDILSFKMFSHWNIEEYISPFRNQIERALNSGHDVQLHIHPHWLLSEFKGNQFIPSRKFKLSDFKDFTNELSIESIIKDSTILLTDLCLKIHDNYKCIAYRGGGYNIKPEIDRIFKALYDNGLRIDSSVVKGLYSKSDLRNEDYRKTANFSNWIVNLEGDLENKSNFGLLEIPVSTMPISYFERIIRMTKKIRNKEYYKKIAYNHTGKGFSFKNDNFVDKIKNAYFSPLVLSFDNYTTDIKILKKIIDFSINKYRSESEILLCSNSHPKAFGVHQQKLMSDFIDLIKSEYNEIIEFSTYRNIYDEKFSFKNKNILNPQ